MVRKVRHSTVTVTGSAHCWCLPKYEVLGVGMLKTIIEYSIIKLDVRSRCCLSHIRLSKYSVSTCAR